jgi:hypothetical protein
MNHPVQRKATVVMFLISLAHLFLGAYAAYDGGFFAFGLTAPERYIYQLASGDETHISVSGALKYVIKDLCFQRCANCPLKCYQTDRLTVDCSNSCVLKTRRGAVLASDGESFKAVIKEGAALEDATFRCYEKACGFDIILNENQTYSSALPEAIARK